MREDLAVKLAQHRGRTKLAFAVPGALGGAAVGGLAGALTGDKNSNKFTRAIGGAAIGAGIGGAGGAAAKRFGLGKSLGGAAQSEGGNVVRSAGNAFHGGSPGVHAPAISPAKTVAREQAVLGNRPEFIGPRQSVNVPHEGISQHGIPQDKGMRSGTKGKIRGAISGMRARLARSRLGRAMGMNPAKGAEHLVGQRGSIFASGGETSGGRRPMNIDVPLQKRSAVYDQVWDSFLDELGNMYGHDLVAEVLAEEAA